MSELMYKITYTGLDNSNLSLSADGTPMLPRQLILNYEVNQAVKPEVGKCFVFDTKQNALEFLHYYGGNQQYKLWLCEVDNPIRASVITLELNSISMFWRWGFWHLPRPIPAPILILSKPPQGTYFCDSVKLLEEVKLND